MFPILPGKINTEIVLVKSDVNYDVDDRLPEEVFSREPNHGENEGLLEFWHLC